MDFPGIAAGQAFLAEPQSIRQRRDRLSTNNNQGEADARASAQERGGVSEAEMKIGNSRREFGPGRAGRHHRRGLLESTAGNEMTAQPHLWQSTGTLPSVRTTTWGYWPTPTYTPYNSTYNGGDGNGNALLILVWIFGTACLLGLCWWCVDTSLPSGDAQEAGTNDGNRANDRRRSGQGTSSTEYRPINAVLSDHEMVSSMGDPANWRFVPCSDSELAKGVSIQGNRIAFRQASIGSTTTLLTNLPVPWLPSHDRSETRPILYFEVTIVHLAPRATLAIGLASAPYAATRLPGYDSWSTALHSNNGRVYASEAHTGHAYARPMHVGDVVGVGIDTVDARVFFTLNGARLPNVERGPRLPCPEFTVYPAVGAVGVCRVTVNFGGGGGGREAAVANGIAIGLSHSRAATPMCWEVARAGACTFSLDTAPPPYNAADDAAAEAAIGFDTLPPSYSSPPATLTRPNFTRPR